MVEPQEENYQVYYKALNLFNRIHYYYIIGISSTVCHLLYYCIIVYWEVEDKSCQLINVCYTVSVQPLTVLLLLQQVCDLILFVLSFINT